MQFLLFIKIQCPLIKGEVKNKTLFYRLLAYEILFEIYLQSSGPIFDIKKNIKIFICILCVCLFCFSQGWMPNNNNPTVNFNSVQELKNQLLFFNFTFIAAWFSCECFNSRFHHVVCLGTDLELWTCEWVSDGECLFSFQTDTILIFCFVCVFFLRLSSCCCWWTSVAVL